MLSIDVSRIEYVSPFQASQVINAVVDSGGLRPALDGVRIVIIPGHTDQRGFSAECWDDGYIRVFAHPSGQYPHHRVKHGTETVWENWEQELAHVLAHEIRHLQQFRGEAPINMEDDEACEQDADMFAVDLVNRLRGYSLTVIEDHA